MSSKPANKRPSSLALRLTLWYAAIFTISSVVAFTVVYFIITSILQFQTDEDLKEDVSELSATFINKGLDKLREEIGIEATADGMDKVFFRLTNKDGSQIFATDMTTWPGLEQDISVIQSIIDDSMPVLKTFSVPGHDHKARVIYAMIDENHVIEIGQSLEEDDEFLDVFRNVFAIALPIFMIAAGFLGWFMAKKALRGVEEVTEAAIDISKGKLDRRVPESDRGDEIDRLAMTFNSMLDRIQTLIAGMREMTDNIAHDLKSPLARIRGIAEASLAGKKSIENYQSVAENTIEECDRLLHMINTMLDIAETETGITTQSMKSVDLSNIIKDACELFQTLAEDKNIELNCTFTDNILINGNVHYLQRLIANLIDNAIKYTNEGGRISVNLDRTNHEAVVIVQDNGTGIEEKDLKNIFERFYRCDQSRSLPGSGLGLSLALAIAHAHGGNITVESTPNQGSRFIVTLPLAN